MTRDEISAAINTLLVYQAAVDKAAVEGRKRDMADNMERFDKAAAKLIEAGIPVITYVGAIERAMA